MDDKRTISQDTKAYKKTYKEDHVARNATKSKFCKGGGVGEFSVHNKVREITGKLKKEN